MSHPERVEIPRAVGQKNATIFALTSRKQSCIRSLYDDIIQDMDKRHARILLLRTEPGSFEAGVTEGLRDTWSQMLNDMKARKDREIQELWSRVEKENGIEVGEDEEEGKWGLKLPWEQLDEAFKRLDSATGTLEDWKARFLVNGEMPVLQNLYLPSPRTA
ncbi:hypothetical protein ACLOAV_004523 [Pseudogymnoascus australis]